MNSPLASLPKVSSDPRVKIRHTKATRIVSTQLPKQRSSHSKRVSEFIAERQLTTPFLVIDLDVVASNYYTLRRSMPAAEVYYAVKANPEPRVIELLAGLGSCFDVASPAEIELVFNAGVDPSRISYGNTIKKQRDIEWAFAHGIRLFAFDSEAELIKLAQSAPGAQVFCRLLTTCEGADWPLSRKFGCDVDMARDLLLRARDLGLDPCGVSFHVGSQQTRLDQWNVAVAKTLSLFTELRAANINLRMINLGGGLPAHYRDEVASVQSYTSAIMAALKEHFGTHMPLIIMEPGRSLVGDSGVLETEVVLISRKSYTDDIRWVYLDIGKFGGLAETHEEAFKYRIEVLHRSGPTGPVVLAGPTCDSVDILYEKFNYQLPLSLKVGDHLRIHATGAYTTSYASVGFNGFPPLRAHCF